MSATWPRVKLGEVLTHSQETVEIRPEFEYSEVTVKLWGKGVMQRGIVAGSQISGHRRFVARAGQFILSRIDARNGATGIVPPGLDGAVVTNDFPVFDVDTTRIQPTFLGWLSKTPDFVDLCKRASEGTTNRVRLQEARFLALEIQLPRLTEQRRIVARIDELAAKIVEARQAGERIRSDIEYFLFAFYRRITEGTKSMPMGSVAPLIRRAIPVDPTKDYPQVAVRSFGRGTFQKPPLKGNEVTWQKPYLVRSGDILISNIKAWEGAIAVATASDDSRVGSHRYLTCVPKDGVVTARFACFHLLTPEGLRAIGEASPGSADRNRTLSTRALMQIPIPLPAFKEQLRFDMLSEHADALRELRAETATELDALLPSILDKAFRGDL